MISYWVRGEYPKALEYAQKALPLCQTLGDRKCREGFIELLTVIYKEMGEYQKAIDNSQKRALLFSESLNLRPISLMNIFPSSLGALL